MSQLRSNKEFIKILHPDLAMAGNKQQLFLETAEKNQKERLWGVMNSKAFSTRWEVHEQGKQRKPSGCQCMWFKKVPAIVNRSDLFKTGHFKIGGINTICSTFSVIAICSALWKKKKSLLSKRPRKNVTSVKTLRVP